MRRTSLILLALFGYSAWQIASHGIVDRFSGARWLYALCAIVLMVTVFWTRRHRHLEPAMLLVSAYCGCVVAVVGAWTVAGKYTEAGIGLLASAVFAVTFLEPRNRRWLNLFAGKPVLRR